MVTGAQILVAGVLGGRLYQLQILESEKYQLLAESNRVNVRLLPPRRGNMVDRNGVELAGYKQNFQLLVVAEQIEDIDTLLAAITQIVPLTPEQITHRKKEIKNKRPFVPVQIADGLSWDQVTRLSLQLPRLPGANIEVGSIRAYPMKDAAAHVLGYVGPATEAEAKDNPLWSLPGFQVGKTGLEKQYNDILTGEAGTLRVEVNAFGRTLRDLSRREGVAGSDLKLTLDARLQQYAQDILSADLSGSAVVMDVDTGAVLAMASYPSYDPNAFVKGIPSKLWKSLLDNPANPLNNKAIDGQYPPGSTFKMLTGIAGLEAGVIDENTSFYCNGHLSLGKSRFHCWKKEGHGRMNIVDALTQSCDVFFYEVALKVGIEKISEVARRFGLGADVAYDFSGAKAGLVPDEAWKRANLEEGWHRGETVIVGIGQGYLKTTPLQLATMTARMVNTGKAVKPWLVQSKGGEILKPEWPDLVASPSHLALVRMGMDKVVNTARGTAYSSRFQSIDPLIPEMMGGKTGTSQVKRITMEERAAGVKNENLPWKFRHHALFVGYAPLDKPRFATCVVVEHGVGGGKAAAPKARDILYKAIELETMDRKSGVKP